MDMAPQSSVIITKNAEGFIVSARTAISKAHTLIQDNKQKLANKKKKVEELETVKSRVQQKLDIHISKLETFQAQLAARKPSSDEELRVQVLAEVEEVHQRDVRHLNDQIKSLAERD